MIFTSRHPTLSIPADAAIWNVVEQHARAIGDKPAFVCGVTERTISYAQLVQLAKKLCAGLAANGLKKGDESNCEGPAVPGHPSHRPRPSGDATVFEWHDGPSEGSGADGSSDVRGGNDPSVHGGEDGLSPGNAAVLPHHGYIDFPHQPVHGDVDGGVARVPTEHAAAHGREVQDQEAASCPTTGQVPREASSGQPVRPFLYNPGQFWRSAIGKGVGASRVEASEHTGSSELRCHREGSSGTLFPNVELKVKCLDTGADLGPNHHGELLFRGPTLMKGYFNNLDASRESFTEDGFLRTGDIGYIDDDGFVFIVDRLKELIKYKGHQVAPAEVEDVVNSHPQVADSGCVRGHDPMTGEEIPKVYVVLEEGSSLSADELMDYVATKVTGYKRAREVEFVDSIPKSLSGKILRRVLQMRENEKLKATRSRL
ncbi:hypothetical protein ON010_g9259 [Phytophthora cinnamomi]|nr:hypothetical protein ON010_g9259 [Phytophthora cinnamomi]